MGGCQFADGENVPGEPLDYELVEEPDEAHLTITYSKKPDDCDVSGGSCIRPGQYGGQTGIYIENIRDRETLAFWVGYWLAGDYFEERPEIFDTESYQEAKEWPSE